MRGIGVVQLLKCEPELGDGLSEEDLAVASRALLVPTAVLREGSWSPRLEPAEAGCLGYLIAKGLLVRRVEVAQGSSVELLGRGDLLRPWQEDASSFCAASWEVLEQSTLLALGPGFTRGLTQWSPVAANLAMRGLRRSRALAAEAAIASIVGVHLSIRIPHRLLAEMVGARRPSITTALAQLEEAGRLDSGPEGGWILLGDPPC